MSQRKKHKQPPVKPAAKHNHPQKQNNQNKQIKQIKQYKILNQQPQDRKNPVPVCSEQELDTIGKNSSQADARISALVNENRSLKNKLHKLTTTVDLVTAQVKNALSPININVSVNKLNNTNSNRDTKHTRTEIPVLCLGDWHIGHYHPRGEYAYDFSIAERRVELTIDKFLSTTFDRRTSARIDELHLYLIGDMVEGENMRLDQAHSIEMSVAEQAVHYAPTLLSKAILRLADVFNKIHIVAVPGNHGRNGPYKSSSSEITNFDTICYEVTKHAVTSGLAKTKATCSITWDLPLDRHMTDKLGDYWYGIDYVFDWCNCVIHGEDLKGSGSYGIPYYGVDKLIRKYADILPQPIDHMYMGHVHVDATIPANFREVFINGAIDSASVYVRKQIVASTVPSQSAVFYTKEHGAISRHKFYLDDHQPIGNKILEALNNRHRS